jgi:hypothetical protein
MPDWVARIIRTILQLIAGGAFAELFLQVAKDVPPEYTPYVIIISTLLVTICQNIIEQTTGKALLKPADAETART